ncbi:MAG: hypothetical protein L0958_03235, partial [Candidatus Mariimomonas ferrooxydans]
ASAVMGFVGWLTLRGDMWCAPERCTLWMQSGKTVEKTMILAGVIGLCIAIYLFIMYLMKSEELKYLINIRKKKNDS